MCNLNSKEPIKFSNLGKVLFLNFSIAATLILSFKFLPISILLLILMPICCRLYLQEKLFMYFVPMDLFTTIIFAISLIPGSIICILLDSFKPKIAITAAH